MKGKDLKFTKEGVMYKYGKKTSLSEAHRKSVGGKSFKSLNAAFSDIKKELGKLGKKSE
jgi:hypothetical protein